MEMEVERLNEFIQLRKGTEKEVQDTCCIARKDDTYLFVNYNLGGSDCLFDFSSIANQLEIKISWSYFEKYAETFEVPLTKQDVCCNTQQRIHELLTCTQTGIARQVFLESTVLYLLFQLQKNNLLFQLQCDGCSFANQPIDNHKIQQAKSFINTHLADNIRIADIASHVGTNQCYLKKSFKEATGQTIFEYVQEHRMVKARHLLQSSEVSVADIAYAVGYGSLSSFSQTYKNYFGLSPSQSKKQKIPNY